jgi:hydrogenase-1 operon protein HyaF
VTNLDAITVRVEPATGNVAPLLHEIRHALMRMAAGEGDHDANEPANGLPMCAHSASSVIDLRSLPLAPGEEERIEEILGIGEVRAELDALGLTIVQETRVSGVWLITHRNTDDEVVAKFIEVTRIPAILLAQDEDVRHGVEYLNKELGIED